MKKEKGEKNVKKDKKKIDKYEIFTKIIAFLLVTFMLLGTCYTFIYLIINYLN